MSGTSRVFVPYRKGERLSFGPFDPAKESAIDLGGIRQSQPLKSFLNHPREKVTGGPDSDSRPVVIAGVKGCDLQSLVLQDFVFKDGDLKDPFYVNNRERCLIISSDCTYARETCFCTAMAGAPYPKKYFDLNLSDAGGSFLVEVGSEKGMGIVNVYKTFFRDALPGEIEKRDAGRQKVAGEVSRYISERGTPNTEAISGMMKRHYNTVGLWQDSSSTCVECGACNLVCPTCHCFLLFDEKVNEGSRRLRIWDSCLYNSFARVAGGANPRKHLYERLRNRFDKKFAFFPEVLDYFACTGCGRCIEACPGDIDIREVLKGLVRGEWSKPPHK